MNHEPLLTILDAAILRYLDNHHGRKNAIGMRHLARVVGISTRMLQNRIKALIEEHGFPIGSSTIKPYGYYVIESPEEVDASINQLVHRIASLAKRVSKIKKIAVEEVYNQMRLV